jgi:steroid 5-alpha reductase family enzyme
MSENSNHKELVKKSGEIDRSHDLSLLPKIVFFVLHFGTLLLCFYMVWGNGISTIGRYLGYTWSVIDPIRGQILIAVVTLYWFRNGITLFYLLVRKVEWGEVLGLSIFMLFFEVGLCLLGAGILRETPMNINIVDGIAVILVLCGSFLNSYSEIQRKCWKEDPKNKGKCYTKGLFTWSMHINYFGDTLLFTGWCLLTAYWWTLLLPVMMAASFIFFHIPGLDAYLENRYGENFIEYAKKTKKFIPFIY